jgi:hypothetical protein
LTHESFYSATLIEFTVWDDGQEKTIEKFDSFNDLPSQMHDELKNNSSEIMFQGKRWHVLEISRDLCQHGKGTHVKVRLELI